MVAEGTGHFDFPDFVRGLPEADLPFEGLRGWLLQSEDGQVLFMETDVDVDVAEHSHGDQWGIVVDGQIELTIGGETAIYRRGDSYCIPAGVEHGARLFAGFKALDYFKDRDRYRVRE